MRTIEHTWVVREHHRNREVMRYCRNCGRTVLFFDTNIRRHNANGKNVYRFAIYKCEKNHTWNEKLAIYKAYTDHREVPDTESLEPVTPLLLLSLLEYQQNGIEEVTILIESVEGRFRIDKLLSEQIEGWSRNQIIRRIRDGQILVNQRMIKPGTTLSARDLISIQIK